MRRDIDLQAMTLQRIEKAVADGFKGVNDELAALKKTVGFCDTDEHGQLIGIGIAGDLGRLRQKVDKRFGLYDAWTRYATGAVAGFGFLCIAVWWLIQDKIGKVLK